MGLSAALEDLDSIHTRIDKAVRDVNTAFHFLVELHTDVDLATYKESIRCQLEDKRDIDD